jgi:hypothetical protein
VPAYFHMNCSRALEMAMQRRPLGWELPDPGRPLGGRNSDGRWRKGNSCAANSSPFVSRLRAVCEPSASRLLLSSVTLSMPVDAASIVILVELSSRELSMLAFGKPRVRNACNYSTVLYFINGTSRGVVRHTWWAVIAFATELLHVKASKTDSSLWFG